MRRNPIRREPQPTLFGEDEAPYVSWMQGKPAELRAAATAGELTKVDLEEMAAWQEKAENTGSTQALEATGISHDLAVALGNGLGVELWALRDAGLDQRRGEKIKPFVEYWRSRALSEIEYETEGDGKEEYVDLFIENLDDDAYMMMLVNRAKELLEKADFPRLDALGDLPDEEMQELLKDIDLYEFSVNKGIDTGGALQNFEMGRRAAYSDGPEDNPELRGILAGLSKEDRDKAVTELGNEEPYISFSRKNPFSGGSIDFTVDMTDYWTMDVNFDMEKLTEKMNEALGAENEALGAENEAPQEDTIAYRFTGMPDTVGGNSARGMYVVSLRPGQLSAEGAALGICLGRKDLGYGQRLKEQKIALYSVRTEVGKPKFAIEIKRDGGELKKILQVKGKANRLPGFVPSQTQLAKVDEVKIVVEFLLSLGFTPENITEADDLEPGIEALQAAGIDPFTPAPIQKREKGAGRPRQANPVSASGNVDVSPAIGRRAKKAMSRGWGGGPPGACAV